MVAPATSLLVTTRVTQVTVFRNGALVVRRGEGRGHVEVMDLPLLFSSDSLRVKADLGDVRDVAESARLSHRAAPDGPTEAARERLTLELARIDDALRTCDLLMETYGDMTPEPPDPRAGPLRLPDGRLLADLVDFGSDRVRDLLAHRAVLAEQRRAVLEERARLDARSGELEPARPQISRGVRFRLDDGGTGFSLEYFVAAARWVPSYSLHLDDGKDARLVTAALIAQASGEDWSGAHISVSTADLARSTSLPALSSWRIGRTQPAVARGFRALPSDLPSLFTGYDEGRRRPSGPPPAPAPTPSAMREESVWDGEEAGAPPARKIAAPAAMRVSSEPMAPEDADDRMAAVPDPMADFEPSTTMARAPAPRSPRMRTAAASMAPHAPTGGAAPPLAAPVRAAPATHDLPPRWRTAILRMAGPDEPQRGALVPLDPIAHIAWLLAAHDVDGAGAGGEPLELQRALQTLTEAQARLLRAPLPRGTFPLLEQHFPSVMHAAAPADVPGDGTFYRVEVRVDETPPRIEHRAVPRESNDVWRLCLLELRGPPLPPGPLAVYENGSFRVNARLDGSGSGRPLWVNLGIDPDVRVVSRTAQVHQAEKGLMGQTSRVEHRVQTEVRSTSRHPVHLGVHDRLPVPDDNVRDVNVQVLESKPPLERTQRDALGSPVEGAFRWSVTIMPGDVQRLDLHYAIELPAKAELEGGNRRE